MTNDFTELSNATFLGLGWYLRFEVLHSRDTDSESWQGAGVRPQPRGCFSTHVDARIPPSLDIADGHAGGGGHLRLKVLHSRDADTESWQGAGFRPQPRECFSTHM